MFNQLDKERFNSFVNKTDIINPAMMYYNTSFYGIPLFQGLDVKVIYNNGKASLIKVTDEIGKNVLFNNSVKINKIKHIPVLYKEEYENIFKKDSVSFSVNGVLVINSEILPKTKSKECVLNLILDESTNWSEFSFIPYMFDGNPKDTNCIHPIANYRRLLKDLGFNINAALDIESKDSNELEKWGYYIFEKFYEIGRGISLKNTKVNLSGVRIYRNGYNLAMKKWESVDFELEEKVLIEITDSNIVFKENNEIVPTLKLKSTLEEGSGFNFLSNEQWIELDDFYDIHKHDLRIGSKYIISGDQFTDNDEDMFCNPIYVPENGFIEFEPKYINRIYTTISFLSNNFRTRVINFNYVHELLINNLKRIYNLLDDSPWKDTNDYIKYLNNHVIFNKNIHFNMVINGEVELGYHIQDDRGLFIKMINEFREFIKSDKMTLMNVFELVGVRKILCDFGLEEKSYEILSKYEMLDHFLNDKSLKILSKEIDDIEMDLSEKRFLFNCLSAFTASDPDYDEFYSFDSFSRSINGSKIVKMDCSHMPKFTIPSLVKKEVSKEEMELLDKTITKKE